MHLNLDGKKAEQACRTLVKTFVNFCFTYSAHSRNGIDVIVVIAAAISSGLPYFTSMNAGTAYLKVFSVSFCWN